MLNVFLEALSLHAISSHRTPETDGVNKTPKIMPKLTRDPADDIHTVVMEERLLLIPVKTINV